MYEVETTEGLSKVGIKHWLEWYLNAKIPFRRRYNRLNCQAMSSARSQRQLCTAKVFRFHLLLPLSVFTFIRPISTAVFIIRLFYAQSQDLIMTGGEGGFSTFCHSCGFACQKSILKTYCGPGCLHSEN